MQTHSQTCFLLQIKQLTCENDDNTKYIIKLEDERAESDVFLKSIQNTFSAVTVRCTTLAADKIELEKQIVELEAARQKVVDQGIAWRTKQNKKIADMKVCDCLHAWLHGCMSDCACLLL